jgi:hypothetical protein
MLIKIFLICHLISVGPSISVSSVHRGSSDILLKVYCLLIFFSFHLRQNRFFLGWDSCLWHECIQCEFTLLAWIALHCLCCHLKGPVKSKFASLIIVIFMRVLQKVMHCIFFCQPEYNLKPWWNKHELYWLYQCLPPGFCREEFCEELWDK